MQFNTQNFVCQRTEHQVITITFANNWRENDIPAISEVILAKLTNVQYGEQIIGADRVTLQFYWQQPWLLHFELYSQSIWLEPAYDDSSKLSDLMHNLTV